MGCRVFIHLVAEATVAQHNHAFRTGILDGQHATESGSSLIWERDALSRSHLTSRLVRDGRHV